ncbi:MAG: glycosyltransferase [Brevinematales bacterium]|nr:glycosyltransferase [Brevinematales bacterium]
MKPNIITKLKISPILLFVYNRPWHTRETVEALKRNELASESELFIYSDGAKNEEARKNVEEVRKYIHTISGFKKIYIIEREKNYGLANNIIDGVTKIVNEYGRVIVLEDDLVTSSGFLRYMNEGLELYAHEEKVASIHGYIYPLKHPEELPETFFIRGADCWGWATWARAWKYFEPDGKKLLEELKKRKLTKEFDFNGAYPYTKMLENQIKGKNNSWAIRWYASAFLNGMVTLYPRYSLVRNIGLDNSGTHCGATKVFDSHLSKNVEVRKTEIRECSEAKKRMEFYLRYTKHILLKDKVKEFLKILSGENK